VRQYNGDTVAFTEYWIDADAIVQLNAREYPLLRYAVEALSGPLVPTHPALVRPFVLPRVNHAPGASWFGWSKRPRRDRCLEWPYAVGMNPYRYVDGFADDEVRPFVLPRVKPKPVDNGVLHPLLDWYDGRFGGLVMPWPVPRDGSGMGCYCGACFGYVPSTPFALPVTRCQNDEHTEVLLDRPTWMRWPYDVNAPTVPAWTAYERRLRGAS
jgi:hypothetical protein